MSGNGEGIMSYVSVSGVTSIGVSLWLYLLSRSADAEAKQLSGLRVLEHLKGTSKVVIAMEHCRSTRLPKASVCS